MKIKDYFRLSKISLKSRKKSTKSTVRGISFGLILLMPLLFLVIAFYIDLDSKVNEDVSVRVFNIPYSKEKTDHNYVELLCEEYHSDIESLDGVTSILKYNYFSLTNNEVINENDQFEMKFLTSVKIGNDTINLNYHNDNRRFNSYSSDQIGFTIIYDGYESLFHNYDYQVLNGEETVLYGTEFSENSNKEIMVSSDFLNHYNLNGEDIIGKELTVSYELNYSGSVSASLSSIENEGLMMYDNMPVSILSNFKVVGIFNSKIYNSLARSGTCRQTNTYEDTFVDSYFWITSASMLNANNDDYIPDFKFTSDGDRFFYYEKNPITMSNEAKFNECIFIPLGFGGNTLSRNNEQPQYYELIEFDSYSDANNAVKIIDGLYKKSSTSVKEVYVGSDYQTSTFINYNIFYNVFTYVCIVLAMFGGIIFFATLLNLYNTIHYSVQSRRNYIGMMRAIGMKSRNVVSLFFTEVFQIFTRSYFWTAIFGGLICGGLSYLFSMVMNSNYAALITIKLTLNPIYILISFGILVILNMLISVVFALVASYGVSKKPVLDVLNENR